MTRILVTGFGPFGQYTVNPSWEAVKALPPVVNETTEVVTRHVAVAYDVVRKAIPEWLEELRPDCVINVGVGEQGCLKLETVAHNSGYVKPDINGNLPPNGCVVDGNSSDTINTDLEVDRLLALIKPKWKCSRSTDAGRFLCEFIYYTSLHQSTQTVTTTGGHPQCLFVHLPPVGAPYSQEELNNALKLIIESIDTKFRMKQ